MPQDECTDPKGPKDQGVFASQKEEYLRGKFIRITPDALLKNQKLVKGACVPAYLLSVPSLCGGARPPTRFTATMPTN